MATIKSYTDLSQYKKLAEILSIESADNVIVSFGSREGTKTVVMSKETLSVIRTPFADIRETTMCWSLAALLGVIPYNVSFNNAVYRFKLVKFSTHWECYHENFGSVSTEIFKADNPIDACVAMVIKLHELKKL